MAITTLDGAIAGMKAPVGFYKATGTMEAAGVHHSLLYASGSPPAAAAPSPGLNGAALTSYAGQIPVPAASGNTHLARLSVASSVNGVLVLCDRLWHNSGLVVTTTTAQSITPVAIPSRDADGATNGRGVYAAMEVSTATTNAAAVTNMTISYTDAQGTAGATGSIPSTRAGGGFPATAVAGAFIPFDLAAGDDGVRSVQSVTLGTSLVTGTVHLVLYRPILSIPVPLAGTGAAVDIVTSGMPRLFDNSVPFFVWFPTATTTGTVQGEIAFTQG